MKKILCLFLSISLFWGFTSTTYAADYTVQEFVDYLEDGSYFTTTIVTNRTSKLRALNSNTCSGSKTTTYKSSSGKKLWSVTVNGSFTYTTGASAKCTKSTVSTSTYSSSWKVSNSSASKSGNKANATATGTQYLSSIPIGSIKKTVTLTCSVKGTLS